MLGARVALLLWIRMHIGRLIVAFFTRPIRLSDFDVRRLARRRGRADTQEATDEERESDFAVTRIVASGEAVDAWGRSLAAEVSEEPAHTLPAELQDELGLRENGASRGSIPES